MDGMFIAKSKTALMQTFLIAYLTGILWLRRNPLSLIFSAISPFSLLFILFIISDGKYLPLSITGSLVMALVGYGLSLGQDISFYKNEYKIQDVFVASPVSPITYMVGSGYFTDTFRITCITGIVVIGHSVSIIFNLHSSTDYHYITCMGLYVFYGIFSIISHATYAQCFANNIICKRDSFYPTTSFLQYRKVTYPVSICSYFVPTTHASLMIQSMMGIATPKEWSIEFGLFVQVAYLIGVCDFS